MEACGWREVAPPSESDLSLKEKLRCGRCCSPSGRCVMRRGPRTRSKLDCFPGTRPHPYSVDTVRPRYRKGLPSRRPPGPRPSTSPSWLPAAQEAGPLAKSGPASSWEPGGSSSIAPFWATSPEILPMWQLPSGSTTPQCDKRSRRPALALSTRHSAAGSGGGGGERARPPQHTAHTWASYSTHPTWAAAAPSSSTRAPAPPPFGADHKEAGEADAGAVFLQELSSSPHARDNNASDQ